MTNTPSKAARRPQEARTQAGVGMGSHSTSQRVVGRLNRSVLKTKRTYGFCTGQRRVQIEASAPATTRPSMRPVSRPGAAARRPTLAPPGLACTGGDFPQFFPPFFNHRVIPDNQCQ